MTLDLAHTTRLTLAPLGAGDLIDRTVRLYRRHFGVLVRMSVPPVVVSAAGAVAWTLGVRGAGRTDSSGALAAYVALGAAGVALQLLGLLLYVVVMGGATRNLVAHLLAGERVAVRTVYRSVRERFWRLVGACVVVGAWLGIAAGVALFAWLMVAGFASVGVLATGAWLGVPEWALAVAAVAAWVAGAAAALALLLFLGGQVAYVLQAMMVEGRGVMAAINRSVTLARGHVRRLAGVILFTTFASYAAWLLLVTPLLYVGFAQGYNLNPFADAEAPMWYEIGYQVAWQASSVLLAPVWMLGLSLLYIDERVRQEGYDIELMAARVLGDAPQLPQGHFSPLAPALAGRGGAAAPTVAAAPYVMPTSPAAAGRGATSIFNLRDAPGERGGAG